MPNKVIIKNRLKDKDEELAKKLEIEARKKMLWRFQKDVKEKDKDSKKEDK